MNAKTIKNIKPIKMILLFMGKIIPYWNLKINSIGGLFKKSKNATKYSGDRRGIKKAQNKGVSQVVEYSHNQDSTYRQGLP